MNQVLDLDPALVRKYDVRGPRYTSYPTVPQFSAAFGAASYEELASARGAQAGPLSLYVHIPFCRTVCFYCGCNKIITANYSRAKAYLGLLRREAEMLGALFGACEVTQLHFGGGTPTYLADADLQELMQVLRRNFRLSDSAHREFSIEIDPRTVSESTVARLAQLGFNRMSLGVQDFDAQVQQAVNRIQSIEHTAAVLVAARLHGLTSTNFDLIYGLPRQSESSFARTLDTVIGLRPERLAIYSYAHLPELFKVQRNIREEELPGPDVRLKLLQMSVARLMQAGYAHIGMDHFALPDDDLARAQRGGTLHRNFQGYSTHASCTLVGLGVSAISDLGVAYAQNARDVERYSERLEQGLLPMVHGVQLTPEDLLRRDVIQDVMCRGRIDVPAIESRHGISFAGHFAHDLARLAPLIDDKLVTVAPEAIEVTPRGRFFLRNVAMAFDAYARAAGAAKFSKAV